MATVDWIAIGLIVAFAVLGWTVGFGRGLRFFTKGIFGIVISVILCYFFLGVVLSWGFVDNLSGIIDTAIKGDGTSEMRVWLSENSFVNKAMWAVILFVVLQILRVIIIKFIAGIFGAKNILMKIINKSLGAVLFVAVLIIVALLVAHFIMWGGGSTADTVYGYLSESKIGLDFIFTHNPLTSLITGQ